ncbi:MAG: (Fe-S)-binding protein [Mesorhizobium sp.]|nr:(Fe-S)-binding protein [Mesorhizobium sp.]
MRQTSSKPPRVGLFVTCLVDLFRPSVGFAAVKLLEDAGCIVEVPAAQSCCGRPSRGVADAADARAAAEATIRAFEDFDYVVAPSGSCAETLMAYHADYFAGDEAWTKRARAFCAKVHELAAFLVDVMGVSRVDARLHGSVTYQDACGGGLAPQPRRLLASVEGLSLREMEGAATCCGLGAAGCVSLAGKAAAQKAASIRAAGAGMLLAGDLGCLMGLAGRLKRDGSAVEVRHVAEVLAGMNDTPPIGAGGAS